jgi:hypothetical protein
MSSQAAMSLLCVAEFALWAVLSFLFWIGKLHRRFPAMGAYLALRVASMPALLFLLYGQERHWFNGYSFDMYFYGYWAMYFASAVLLFFICIEVFRSALSGFSGLQRLGTVAFRWVALVSAVVSLSTLSFVQPHILLIPAIAYRLMSSVSILELCLLAFLCLSMNALRLSVRGMAFGIALGFGLMSSSDFILASFISRNTSLTGSLQFVSESVILLALGIWVAYCAVPQSARLPVMVPASSLIFRWNEIASALGHTGTQVAMRQPDGGILLTDVENVVENALAQNREA